MRRVVIILLCLAALVGVGYWTLHRQAGQPAQGQSAAAADGAGGTRRGAAGQAIPVLVAASAQQDVPIYLDALGTVQAFYTVTVHSMIDGPLTQVGFTEGQDVKAGDVLARIDPRPYQAALDQAVAKKAQDEATLANARLDLTRYAKLAQTNYTTQQQADTQRATVAEDQAIVQQDQASIDTARTNLSYTAINSPIDGRTGIRNVDPGNIIHASDTNGLVVITQVRPIAVIFTLPQQTLGDVRAAMQNGPAQVIASPQGSTQGGPDQPAASSNDSGGGPGLTTASADPAGTPPAAADPPPVVLDRGTVNILDNQVDSSTGTIRLKAVFPNPDLRLWPGGFVNVRLLVRTAKDAITVPPAAVQRGPQGAYVYVITEGKAARRNISVGHEDESVAVVTAGLKRGETVVTDGASRLTEGAAVTLPKTAANPNSASPERVQPPGTAAAHRPHRNAS